MRRGCQTIIQQAPAFTRSFGSGTATALKRNVSPVEDLGHSQPSVPRRRDWSNPRQQSSVLPQNDKQSFSRASVRQGGQPRADVPSGRDRIPSRKSWSNPSDSTQVNRHTENRASQAGSHSASIPSPTSRVAPRTPSDAFEVTSTPPSSVSSEATPIRERKRQAFDPRHHSIPTRKSWTKPEPQSSSVHFDAPTDSAELTLVNESLFGPSRKETGSSSDTVPLAGERRSSHLGAIKTDSAQNQQDTKPSPKTSRPIVQRQRHTNASARNRPDVHIPSTVTVSVLANILGVKLARLQQRMKKVGMGSESNYDYILTSDLASLLAEEFRYNPIVDDEAAFDIHPQPPASDQSLLRPRPPVVTIMGHVDHGKTTLLDTLRSASVAKGEAGGITQHIGAFSVPVKLKDSKQSITFLDTPGHAAFSQMRARGADVTDIIVLVVAADDGIMPQTKEVINLVKSTGSEGNLLVAINKIDKPGVNVDAVKTALMAEGIQLEEFGGDVPSVHVSGLTGAGIPEFLETLWTMAEMMELRAEHTGLAHGHIIESEVRKGLGPVATVLISRGSLKVGSHVICGLTSAKTRMMTDSNGKPVKEAFPGTAVIISGWKSVPKAGDMVLQASEADIKKALVNRVRKEERNHLQADAEAINEARRLEREVKLAEELGKTLNSNNETGPKELRLIVKADVSGSSEAVEGAIAGIGNSLAVSKVVSTGVGDVAESDIMMAKVAGASIIAFSVGVPRAIQVLANTHGVRIISSNIIYKLIDTVREQVAELLPKIVETKVLGEATILQVFEIQVKGKPPKKIAGSRVTNGLIQKHKLVRILRDGQVVFDGSLDTMRQLKKDITEARKGLECGLGFEDFGDFQVDDLIQVYDRIEKTPVL